MQITLAYISLSGDPTFETTSRHHSWQGLAENTLYEEHPEKLEVSTLEGLDSIAKAQERKEQELLEKYNHAAGESQEANSREAAAAGTIQVGPDWIS